MDKKGMIERAAERLGFPVRDWKDDPDDGLMADLGRFRVVEDDEDNGLYEGDEGVLTAVVVGAEKYGNQRVALAFTADGYDSGSDVPDPYVLDPVG